MKFLVAIFLQFIFLWAVINVQAIPLHPASLNLETELQREKRSDESFLELTRVKRDQEKELSRVKRINEAELSRVKRDEIAPSRVVRKEAELSRVKRDEIPPQPFVRKEAELSRVKRGDEAELSRVKRVDEAELSRVKRGDEAELSRVKRGDEAELSRVKRGGEAELSRVKRGDEAELSRVKRKNEAELSRTKRENEKTRRHVFPHMNPAHGKHDNKHTHLKRSKEDSETELGLEDDLQTTANNGAKRNSENSNKKDPQPNHSESPKLTKKSSQPELDEISELRKPHVKRKMGWWEKRAREKFFLSQSKRNVHEKRTHANGDQFVEKTRDLEDKVNEKKAIPLHPASLNLETELQREKRSDESFLELTRAKRDQEKELSRVKRINEAELSRVKRDEIAPSRVERKEAELSRVKRGDEAELSRVKRVDEAELSRVKRGDEAELSRVKRGDEAELSRVKRKDEAELSRTKRENEKTRRYVLPHMKPAHGKHDNKHTHIKRSKEDSETELGLEDDLQTTASNGAKRNSENSNKKDPQPNHSESPKLTKKSSQPQLDEISELRKPHVKRKIKWWHRSARETFFFSQSKRKVHEKRTHANDDQFVEKTRDLEDKINETKVNEGQKSSK